MSASSRLPLSYVLPVKLAAGEDAGDLTDYLTHLREWCDEVFVVDGSAPAVFAANAQRWSPLVHHRAPDPRHDCLNAKVMGVLTGAEQARHEHLVIADDDVRYDRASLARTHELLAAYDLVRPQNVFDPVPWHALWDTARSLLNRAVGADFPGTLAVRRSRLLAAGGYDGNAMFENLELIRTIETAGGRTVAPLDLFVIRRPPTSGQFWGQRIRQAYDDFAIPLRMALWLSILPVLAVRRRSPATLGTMASAAVLVAERGRRRGGGTNVFPLRASLLAPLWVLERAVCSWLAVGQRLRFGGVRYRGGVIPLAAHSTATLRRRAAAREPVRNPGDEA